MKIQNQFALKMSPEQIAEKRDGQMREAATMYENHFLNQMVKAMRSTVNREDSLMRPNMAEKIFSEQLDQQYVEGWGKKGGVGLADMIYNQIRERYAGASKKDFGRAPQVLPLAPKADANGVKSSDSIQFKTIPAGDGAKMEYRFEVTDPSGASFEALSPMGGHVLEARRLGDGWNSVRMDHGRGIESELTFPGHMTEMSPGQALPAGQKLGVLDSARPILAWKLDWEKSGEA